jgi:monofunctional biosynthetic peptidoglycan transglycosylase
VKRALLLLTAAAAGYTVYVALGLPSPAQVRALARVNPASTVLMRQREAEARQAGRPARRAQAWVPLGRVSRHLIRAVVASEDQKFFGHDGVDWEAIQKSVDEDRKQGRFVRGGSTITQQLAKNLFFSTHKTLTRKLRELVAARWMEQELSKRRILEVYLNVIEWGDGIYGCEAAARHWYGKSAADLDENEAAGLAAMIPNPRRINPRANPAGFARARKRVLWLMARAGSAGGQADRLGAEPEPEIEVDEVEEGEEEPAPEPERTVEPMAMPERWTRRKRGWKREDRRHRARETERPARTGYDMRVAAEPDIRRGA